MAKVKKSARLKTVVQLTEQKEQRAAKILADVRHRLLEAQHQMQNLLDYRDEYSGNFSEIAAKPTHPAMLANYSGFYRSLGRAEEIQQKQIDVLKEQLDRAMKYWQVQYQRRQNMQRLLQTALAQEEQQAEKRLQSQLDDRPVRNKLWG